MAQENQKDLAMTQEQKDLVMKDLCGRLPYGVYVQIVDRVDFTHHTVELNPEVIQKMWSYKSIKPYLRPMSSMTEEEKKEYIEYAGYEIEESVNGRHYEYYLKDFCGTPENPSVNADSIDWLNKKMFDFRGLIPKDLALSTDEYNPYKN